MALLLTCILLSHMGYCQDEPENPTPPPLPDGTLFNLPDVLKDGTLNLKSMRLYLFDNQGKQILVPDETLESFEKLKEQRNTILPSYVLEKTDVQVTVEDRVAKIVGKFEASLTRVEPTQASIPLYFDTCQLESRAEVSPVGSSWVQSVENGYRWFVKGEPNSKHKAILRGEAVITRINERQEIRLPLPLAPSTIRVQLPSNAVDENVRGQGNEIVDRKVEGQHVILSVSGRGGDTTITWRNLDERSRLSIVEGSSTTRLQIDDLRQPWKFSSDVTLRWYGEDANNQIVLELPVGASWTRVPTSPSERFEITTDETTASSAATAKPIAERVLIRNLDPSPMQPIDLRLDWEWKSSLSAEDLTNQQIEIPGLFIRGVDVHTGTLDLLAPANHVVTWRVDSGTQFVQQDAFDRNTYSFRFSRQPLALSVNLRPQSNVALIRPAYLAHVDGNKIKLTAWLDCSFSDLMGTPMSIGIRGKDWNIESAELVEVTSPLANGEPLSIAPQADGTVNIANSDNAVQGVSRQLWRIIAYRWWDSSKDPQLRIDLPQLRQNSGSTDGEFGHGSGVLIVTCDDNMLLKWRAASSAGLLVDTLVPQWQPYLLPEERRNPLVFRFQSHHDAPIFSGTAETLPQQVTLQQKVTLDATSTTVRISQVFQLQIVNEPLEQVQIAVRQDAVQQQDPQVLIDGTPVSLRPISDPNQQDTNATGEPTDNWKYFALVMSDRLRGNVTINVRTAIPWSSVKPTELTSVRSPLSKLLLPTQVRLQDQTWSVSSQPEVEVYALADENGSTESYRPIPLGTNPRSISSSQTEIAITLRKLQSFSNFPVRIGKSWLQTIFNGDERRDRFCAQIETTQPRITVRIPKGRDLKYVTIDGQKVTDPRGYFSDSGTQIPIDLPKSDRKQHQLEIWMSSSELLGWATSLVVVVPEIEGAESYDRFYWQLVVPNVQHLGFGSLRMTPEWNWNWGGLWWHRESKLRQADLERWMGATQQSELPASVNSYVLSSLDSKAPIEVLLLSRFILWLPTGLVAILLSTLLIAFRRLRHPALLLLLGGCIASASTLSPDLAMLIGQTSLASLGLVALILITQAAIEIRVRKRSVFGVRPASIAERSDHISVARNVKVVPSSTAGNEAAAMADGRP